MGSRGGDESFQVPTEFRNGIWDQVQGSETSFDVYNFFNPEPTSLSTVEVTKDETTPWGSTGVQSYWGSESAQMTASSLVTKKDYVGVHQLYAYVMASDELLSDLPRLNDRLTNKAGQAIRFKASNAIVAGDGVGKPKGFTVGGSIVEQAKETNQTADTIVIANIAKMYSRLINPQRGFWMVHPDAFPQIIALQYANGTAAWTDNNMGFKNTPNGRLLGQPIYLTEHNQTLGDAGDIYFVNPDGYLLLQKSSAPEYAESIHLYFDYNIKAFRWIFRMGGQPYSNAAVSPKNGSTTRSHFISLAARG
jgi:HK97 family phage major capsid protein